ncbi:CPBP family intramembrane metalloprotease [Candidatus Microgenomates bacterium]|nr:CPBP family intramembrane metalloprotease [Candidatus Microgenomates bacterium]
MENKIDQENIVLSFLKFLRKPDYSIDSNKKKTAVDLLNILILIIIGLAINSILVYLNYHLFRLFDYDVGNFVGGEADYRPIYYILVVLIGAPVMEELTFRLGLRFSFYNLAFALIFLCIAFFEELRTWIASVDIGWGWLITVFSDPYDWIIAPIMITIVLVLGFLLAKTMKRFLNEQKIRSFYQKRFGYIFYISAILFGLDHLSNFSNFSNFWFLIPFFILPQATGGLILGFLRMRYGFKYAILGHIGNNILSNIIFVF